MQRFSIPIFLSLSVTHSVFDSLSIYLSTLFPLSTLNFRPLFFQVLFLTGQFEAALDFLFRTGDPLSVHAVHLALVLYELGLLSTPESVQAPLISRQMEK